ncbi:hypothetical protein CAOG_08791 [Capsaspora owczarzaki ATCC 30864]|nr:hypothetical protein CAOG_08791 [Capsaspora owczarzaki ATCC 30864]|eukprot:XP_011270431.1 hypothetical protein CAOG_08791 [Capsaspora owczarzaki ATCC 30864]
MGQSLSQIYWPTSSAAMAKAEQELLAKVHAQTPFQVRDIDIDATSASTAAGTQAAAKSCSKSKPLRTIHTLSFNAETSQREANHKWTLHNSRKRVVVLTHGFGAGVGVFYRNLPALASTPGLTIHAIDWLGMGGSSRPPFLAKNADEAENFFVESLELWRQRMGIESFVLCGHSLGGFLSATYALKYPHRVTKLVLISPVGVPKRPEVPAFESRLRASRPMLAAIIERMWSSNVTPQSLVRAAGHFGPALVRFAVGRRFDLPPDERLLLQNYLYHISAATGSGELAFNTILSFGAWARKPLLDRLPGLVMPTTFMYGLYDWMDYRPAAEAQRHMSVKTNIITIGGGGHQMYIEDPVEFNAQLINECLSSPLEPAVSVPPVVSSAASSTVPESDLHGHPTFQPQPIAVVS